MSEKPATEMPRETGVTTRPSSVDELLAFLREHASYGNSVAVTGGGTHQAAANLGTPVDSTIDMTGLDTVIDYSPRDLTIAVQAGCTIATIADTLAAEGQRLVLDLAHPSSATLGGTFATGLSGPRRLRYGSLKDSVLGVEVATVEGDLTKSGGMVVKNVSGYDLTRLHYGAFGIFGIMTRINLKVVPMVESGRLVTADFQSEDEVWAAGQALWNAGLELTSLLILWTREDGWRLDARFEGSNAMTRAQARRCADLIQACDAAAQITTQEIDPRSVGEFERFVDLDSGAGVARFAAPWSRQRHALQDARRAGAKAVCVDPGSGLVYALSEPNPEWRDATRRLFQHATFLSLPPELKRGLDVTGGAEEPVAAILRRLKHEFDPDSRLQPGRGVLGL